MIQPCDFDHPVECLPPLQKADEPLLERPIEEVKVGGTRNNIYKVMICEFSWKFRCFHRIIGRKVEVWEDRRYTVTAFPLLFQAV